MSASPGGTDCSERRRGRSRQSQSRGDARAQAFDTSLAHAHSHPHNNSLTHTTLRPIHPFVLELRLRALVLRSKTLKNPTLNLGREEGPPSLRRPSPSWSRPRRMARMTSLLVSRPLRRCFLVLSAQASFLSFPLCRRICVGSTPVSSWTQTLSGS